MPKENRSLSQCCIVVSICVGGWGSRAGYRGVAQLSGQIMGSPKYTGHLKEGGYRLKALDGALNET